MLEDKRIEIKVKILKESKLAYLNHCFQIPPNQLKYTQSETVEK